MATTGSGDGGGGGGYSALAAVEMAERRRYAALMEALAQQPRLARETDDFGMTPLHWVCSDADVPLYVLERVVLAHPASTAAHNLAGLLPLHLAVRKCLPLEALHALLKFYGKALVIPTPDGKLPARLAMEAGADRETVDYLLGLEREVRELSQAEQGRESRQTAGQYRASDFDHRQSGQNNEDADDYGGVIDEFDESSGLATGAIRFREDNQLDEPSRVSYAGMTTDPVTTPMTSGKLSFSVAPTQPEWKHASNCSICDARFGYLLGRRHHCRNCGESVCGRHSRHAVPLKHLGLFTPQRVCAACFDDIQEHYTARALAKVAPLECFSAFTVPIAPVTASPRVHRFQRSRSVFNEMPVAHSPPRSDNGQLRGGCKPFFATSSAGAMQNIDSMHITRVKRTDRVGHGLQNGGGLPRVPRKHSREHRDSKKLSIADLTSEPDRSLANTELMAHSTAWDEFELDAAGDTNFSASFDGCSALPRALPPPLSLPARTRRRRSKTSMDSQVLELEAQMERLLEARQRISVALKTSQKQIVRARRKKSALDEVASRFRDLGYSSEPEEDELDQEAGVDRFGFSDCGDGEGIALGDDSEDGSRLNSSESTALTTTTTAATSDNEYEDVPHDNASYCDDSVEEDSTDNDEDATTYIVMHPTQVLPLQRPRRPPPRLPTPRLAPALSESHRCFQSMEPPALDVAATHSDLGAALLASGKSSAAAAAFRDALRLDNENADVWHQLATALDAAGGRAKEAEEAARSAVELQPTSLASLSLLGKLLHARGEHEEAISVFRRALKLQSC